MAVRVGWVNTQITLRDYLKRGSIGGLIGGLFYIMMIKLLIILS